jgi:hypothetical protein
MMPQIGHTGAAKNALTAADAKWVEDTFETKLATLALPREQKASSLLTLPTLCGWRSDRCEIGRIAREDH